jgi:hypothetical protein
MNSIAFDTHAAAIRFKRAGFTEDQIEALVEVTRETTALPDVSTLATKADIERLEQATRADIERLEQATRADIERFEQAVTAKFTNFESRMDGRFTQVDARFTQVDARFTQVDARIDKLESTIEAKIGAAQVQSITILIAAMALITTLGSVLPKLLG